MTTIAIDKLGGAFGKLFKSFGVAQRKGLISAAMKGQSWIVSNLLPTLSPPPFDMGAFRAGWNIKPTETGAIIFNPVPHAVFINFGVPAENVRVTGPMLVEWVRRKGFVDGDENPLQVAWRVAMAVRRKGLFMDPQYRITERAVNEFLIEEVPRQIAAELQKVKWKA